MGQCSTLPAEGRQQEHQPGSRYMHNQYKQDDASNVTDQKSTTSRGRGPYRRGDSGNNVLQVTVPRNDDKDSRRRWQQTPPPHQQPPTYQSRQQSPSNNSVQPMEEDTEREAPPLIVDNAKRARCYQLNLESDFVGITGDVRVEGSLLGPYEQLPPPLTYSASDDSSNDAIDPTDSGYSNSSNLSGNYNRQGWNYSVTKCSCYKKQSRKQDKAWGKVSSSCKD